MVRFSLRDDSGTWLCGLILNFRDLKEVLVFHRLGLTHLFAKAAGLVHLEYVLPEETYVTEVAFVGSTNNREKKGS